MSSKAGERPAEFTARHSRELSLMLTAFMSITNKDVGVCSVSGKEQAPKSVNHRILDKLNMSAILFHRPGTNLYYALLYLPMYSSFPCL